jgi:alkylhydroperoxidase family enzyme
VTATRPAGDGGDDIADAAWIVTVPEEEWTGELAALREVVVDPGNGRVDHIMAVHSLNPRGLAAHQAVYASAMRGTPTLRKVERELIALVVSAENDCHY